MEQRNFLLIEQKIMEKNIVDLILYMKNFKIRSVVVNYRHSLQPTYSITVNVKRESYNKIKQVILNAGKFLRKLLSRHVYMHFVGKNFAGEKFSTALINLREFVSVFFIAEISQNLGTWKRL